MCEFPFRPGFAFPTAGIQTVVPYIMLVLGRNMLGKPRNKISSFKYFDVFLEVVIVFGVVDDPAFGLFVKDLLE